MVTRREFLTGAASGAAGLVIGAAAENKLSDLSRNDNQSTVIDVATVLTQADMAKYIPTPETSAYPKEELIKPNDAIQEVVLSYGAKRNSEGLSHEQARAQTASEFQDEATFKAASPNLINDILDKYAEHERNIRERGYVTMQEAQTLITSLQKDIAPEEMTTHVDRLKDKGSKGAAVSA